MIRKILLYVFLVLVYITIPALLITGSQTIGSISDDFVAYWSAGRLIASGENPYSMHNLLMINPELGFESVVLYRFYYPPTNLLIFIPFGILPYQIGRLLWFFLSIAIVIICGIFLWNIYQGPISKRKLVFICVLTFTPFIFMLIEGQITFLILLGVTGFLFFVQRTNWVTAGIFLSLVTIKFHLLYLLWIILIIWIISEKQWWVMVGLVTTTIITMGSVMVLYPFVIREYLLLMKYSAPLHCNHHSLSALFCLFDIKRIPWINFIPQIAGAVWVIFYWRRNRVVWSWKDRISTLIIVSVLTAPLAWMLDGLLFLIPIIEILVLMLMDKMNLKDYVIIMIYLSMNIIAFIMIPTYRYNQIAFLWMPILFYFLYNFSMKEHSKKLQKTNQII